MKTLSDYILLTEKEFKYRLKFAHELSEEHLAKLERLLGKYDLIDVANIYKTPIQKNPLNFSHLDIAEIYIIDIVTRLPVPLDTLRHEISQSLRIHADFIYVGGEKDPYEEYNDHQYRMKYAKDHTAKLDDPFYETDGPKSENLYGDEYNKELVDTVKKHDGRLPTENEKKYDSIFDKAMDKTNTRSLFTKISDNPFRK